MVTRNTLISIILFVELTVAYEGECFAIDKCPNPPEPKLPNLVCSSDGANYTNINVFNCAKLKNKSNL